MFIAGMWKKLPLDATLFISQKDTVLSVNLSKQIVEKILSCKKPEKIVLFGSRATGNEKKTSDIDIAIFGKQWTDRDINMVRHHLEEKIKTPLKFDVINFYSIAKDELKNNILSQGVILYESKTH